MSVVSSIRLSKSTIERIVAVVAVVFSVGLAQVQFAFGQQNSAATEVTVIPRADDYLEVIESDLLLRELAFTGANIAARSGNTARLRHFLPKLEGIEEGSVNRTLGSQAFDFPPEFQTVIDRRLFLIRYIVPYLYPNAGATEFACGKQGTISFYSIAGDDTYSGTTTNSYGCSNGSLNISSIVRESVSRSPEENDISWTTAMQIESPYSRIYYPDGGRFFTVPLDNPAHTLLASAAVAGQLEVMGALFVAGADVDVVSDSGYTALHYATVSNQNASVELLLDRNANPSALTNDGEAPIHMATSENYVSILRTLVGGGADVNATLPSSDTPLIISVKSRFESAVLALLELGALPDKADFEQKTPLIHAMRSASIPIVEGLISSGANVHQPDDIGQIALHHAAAVGWVDAGDRLIRAGSMLDATDDSGRTSLMIASSSGRDRFVGFLVDSEADLNLVDRNGDTAVIHGARAGQRKVVESLIRSGAKFRVKNNAGQTAKSIAKLENRTAVRQLFKQIKPIQFTYLKTGLNLVKLDDDQHESSVSGEFGISVSAAVQRRIRLQTDLGLVFRVTDPDELSGPIPVPTDGDFYYWINTVEVKPSVRYAVMNPYRSHMYVLAGVGYGAVIITELRDWTEDSDGVDVSETTSTSLSYLNAGVGWQFNVGSRLLTNLELTYSKASTIDLDLFEGGLSTLVFTIGFGY